MDVATVIGILASIIIVFLAIFSGGNAALFIEPNSILIVFGGTIATTLIRFPLANLLGTFAVTRKAFTSKLQDPYEVLETLVGLARKSRKDGLLSLEDFKTEDQFLSRGLTLVVDGAEAEAVESVLMTDIRYLKQRHKQGQDIFKSIGEAAPAFGMIGTLVGLVIMLSNMSDVEKLGPAMAVAILTTLYGSLIANIAALPIAKKLEIRSREESLIRELMLVGLVNIAKGENPRMIETVLKAFLSGRNIPAESPAKPREVKAA